MSFSSQNKDAVAASTTFSTVTNTRSPLRPRLCSTEWMREMRRTRAPIGKGARNSIRPAGHACDWGAAPAAKATALGMAVAAEFALGQGLEEINPVPEGR